MPVAWWVVRDVGRVAKAVTSSDPAKAPRTETFTLNHSIAGHLVATLITKWVPIIVLGTVLGLEPSRASDIRWTKSSNRIYLTGPGFATLSEIKAAQAQAPLEQVAPGVWHLRANLIVEEGAYLALNGTRIGGDVDQLRLQSNNSADTNRFVFIKSDWGSIGIRGSSILSWDDAVNGPDTEYATYGRAYILVRSKLATDGVTPLISRMDIIDSDIGYLGYEDSEGYGLTWKASGDQPGLINRVGVYGDVQNSHMHHNYVGVYVSGGHGMEWLQNEVSDNVRDGFAFRDNTDYLLIQGNSTHHNGNNGMIVSQQCDHLTIRRTSSWANAQDGIFLNRNSDDCLVEDNQCSDNGDTGMAIAGSSRCTVRRNLLLRNLQSGVQVNLGSADNLFESNECASNVCHGFYLYKGNDMPEPNDDGRPKRNRLVSNLVHHNSREAINLADSDENTFETNTFYANGDRLRFSGGVNNRLEANAIPAEVVVATEGGLNNPASIHISNQPSLRVQMDAFSSMIFEDDGGKIFDPEEERVATQVTTNGSRLVLTAAEIGTTTTVVARSLWARATEGTLLIEPVDWTNFSGSGKQWAATADSPGQPASYTVGDVGPNRAYVVLKERSPLMTVKSDSAGLARFTDVPGTTNEVLYSIDPCFPVSVKPLVGRAIVSWTGGRIQHATSLSPPNWLDLPVTNGQFRINIKASLPMEFFRAFPEVPLDGSKPPGANFDLTHWKLQMPDATSSEISPAQLAAGFTNSFFFTGADGTMVFVCPVTGGTTSGSVFPRCELRELLDPKDETVNWTGYGTHVLEAQCSVTRIPSSRRTFIAQIHGFNETADPLLKLRFDNGTVEALVKDGVNSTNDLSFPLATVKLGEAIAYQIKMVDGLLSMTVNGARQSFDVFQSDPAWSNQTFYFKAGNYCQDNSGTPDEGAVVSFDRLSVYHSHQ
jgi:mannuronan 5-epimerase